MAGKRRKLFQLFTTVTTNNKTANSGHSPVLRQGVVLVRRKFCFVLLSNWPVFPWAGLLLRSGDAEGFQRMKVANDLQFF
jgi:hypothetical protein